MSTLRSDVRTLLDLVWPGISNKIAIADSLGIYWDSISTPFTRYENGKMVAHVGTFKMPMLIQSQLEEVGTIHAVCTHPDFCQRGYSRSTLVETLSYLDESLSTTILFTEIPEFYKPFGFRPIDTYSFRILISPTEPIGGFRKLSSNSQSDMSILKNIFMERAPASKIYSPRDDGSLFFINEILSHGQLKHVYYAEDIEVIAVYEIEGKTLKLFDFAAKKVPTLTDIIARTGVPIDSVVTYFSPDQLSSRFEEDFVAEAVLPHGGTLMVRGKFEVEGKLFGISPLWQA